MLVIAIILIWDWVWILLLFGGQWVSPIVGLENYYNVFFIVWAVLYFSMVPATSEKQLSWVIGISVVVFGISWNLFSHVPAIKAVATAGFTGFPFGIVCGYIVVLLRRYVFPPKQGLQPYKSIRDDLNRPMVRGGYTIATLYLVSIVFLTVYLTTWKFAPFAWIGVAALVFAIILHFLVRWHNRY